MTGVKGLDSILNKRLRDAKITDVPFLVVLAGYSARRAERRVASHISKVQRRNAPVSAAINGILAVSTSLTCLLRDIVLVLPRLLESIEDT